MSESAAALDHAREDAGLSLDELWVRCFALGGMSSALQLDAYLHGALLPTPHEHNVIAQALDERLLELRSDTSSGMPTTADRHHQKGPAMPSTTTAPPDLVLPTDPEAIMDTALGEEGPPSLQGVRLVTAAELAQQRRMAVFFTVLPVVGVIAAIVLLWGRGIGALDLTLLVAFYAFTMIGVTVGYHRLFTHRSFEVPTPARQLLAIAGTMAAQGSVISWVATHRRHHAYADAYGDPHSPHLVQGTGVMAVVRGLFHAHVGWLFTPNDTVASRWAPDLQREPAIAAIERGAVFFTVLSIVLPAILGGLISWSVWGALTGLVWGSLVRIFLLHHVSWSINSICHFFGKQPFASKDESTNNWPLSLISLGESWHNNHHAFPSSARHGLLRGQVDPSWRVIRTLELLGIARNVRLPSAGAMARKRR